MPDALADAVSAVHGARGRRRGLPTGRRCARCSASVHSADATAARAFPRTVPAKQSRAVAILPLRASGELAEIAEGLSEEIVDALTMTRALRVRPLASVRAAAKEPSGGERGIDRDSRELGEQLGVDVVVDGSIRKRGPQVRISARAIGVADGFQLWASHFDCGVDGLLAVGDEVVRAIARALVVELHVPERAALDARIAERYLEGKARLRAGWVDGRVRDVIASLEEVLPEAPGDPRVLATLAMALARAGFYGDPMALVRARQLADQALAVAPTFGEAQLAKAFVHFLRERDRRGRAPAAQGRRVGARVRARTGSARLAAARGRRARSRDLAPRGRALDRPDAVRERARTRVRLRRPARRRDRAAPERRRAPAVRAVGDRALRDVARRDVPDHREDPG